jgi:acyl carrier protein
VRTVDVQRCLREALHQVVPDADLDHLRPDEPLRDALELDSLDFLSFVEHLSAATGLRIDEDSYRKLTTYQSCVQFLDAAEASAG